MRELWDWVVANFPEFGSAEAYATGVHPGTGTPVTEDEYRNAVGTLLTHVENARKPGSGYGEGFAQDLMNRIQRAGGLLETDSTSYWANEANPTEFSGFVDAVVPRLMQGGSTGATPTAGVTDADASTLPGVLAGGQTIRVNENGTTRFYQVYEFPAGSGKFVSYQFTDMAQVQATLGQMPPIADWTATDFNSKVLAQAQAEEVVGLQGSWQGFTDEIMRDAAAQAGVNDPSLVGQIASDPEMQRIMAQSIIGDWTPAQILAEQRKTVFWNDVLYPGIAKFYGKTTQPEKAWLDYNANVEGGLIALGYAKDADGTYNTQIKRMLDQGLDDQVFLSQVPIFQQAQQNIKYADILNQWTQRDLGKTLDFNDFYGLLAGETLPELQAVAEKATLAYQAQQAQAGITDAQIIRLAAETDMSEQQASALFGEFNRAILALGEPGLRRGGLTRDEVLSAAAGIDPMSGRSIEEVRQLAGKLAQENDLFDEEKIQFYTGYDASGRPVRPGLAGLAPEGAYPRRPPMKPGLEAPWQSPEDDPRSGLSSQHRWCPQSSGWHPPLRRAAWA